MFTRAFHIGLPLILCCLLAGCADPIPTDYVEELGLEGFIIVGEPITNIRVYKTLPVTDTFTFDKAIIRNAQIELTANGTRIPVEYVADSLGGYYRASDTSLRAQSGVEYAITVQALGKRITGTTTPPPVFSYTVPPKDTMQYPGINNELVRFDSLDIFWQAVPGVSQYVVAVECLDTLRYGAYLQPPTSDTNRRVREEDRVDDGTLVANERTRFGFIQQPFVPVVWVAFKWFGKHTISVYAGDQAFVKWFRMVGFGRRSQYDYRLASVQGGVGAWGSASVVRHSTFLLKDKP